MGKCKATFATPNGGEAPMDPRSKKDSESDSVVKEFLNDNEPLRMLKNTVKLDQVDSSKVKLVILIGGEELPFTVQDKLQEMGAKVETQQAFQPNVLVTEERLITAQNSQSSMRFAQIIKETWEKFHREE
ncbi:hypothetical protein ROZALSC1DRAFT_27962 [Rozella allomycis CSF55]|uniref:Uncharacterized protein n=1 Tax=Rozella allomycis (strain CSF55) TaxID=988480 RepID=A0A075B323_ROZAC|nr:hypothetical protein O9G_001405 [Rozella allomycis CSF55]RKP20564.1 hypothetical protein ROZALSC1DRAFT_27962 [Rozella allomycis CSF55]|eukprot:EPZ36960.1 hypothetical protein O9G_001405 [Rozella allomycis CSF55]